MVAAGVVVVDSVEGVVVAVTVAVVDAEVAVVVEEDGDVVASPTTLVDVAVVPDTNTLHGYFIVAPFLLC